MWVLPIDMRGNSAIWMFEQFSLRENLLEIAAYMHMRQFQSNALYSKYFALQRSFFLHLHLLISLESSTPNPCLRKDERILSQKETPPFPHSKNSDHFYGNGLLSERFKLWHVLGVKHCQSFCKYTALIESCIWYQLNQSIAFRANAFFTSGASHPSQVWPVRRIVGRHTWGFGTSGYVLGRIWDSDLSQSHQIPFASHVAIRRHPWPKTFSWWSL